MSFVATQQLNIILSIIYTQDIQHSDDSISESDIIHFIILSISYCITTEPCRRDTHSSTLFFFISRRTDRCCKLGGKA